MITKPKSLFDSTDIAPDGAVVLRLTALGIDHRAEDFPARSIAFCEQNDLYEMEVNAVGGC